MRHLQNRVRVRLNLSKQSIVDSRSLSRLKKEEEMIFAGSQAMPGNLFLRIKWQITDIILSHFVISVGAGSPTIFNS